MTPKAKRIEANGDFTDYRLEQAYVAEALSNAVRFAGMIFSLPFLDCYRSPRV
jgi:hypothetical protein